MVLKGAIAVQSIEDDITLQTPCKKRLDGIDLCVVCVVNKYLLYLTAIYLYQAYMVELKMKAFRVKISSQLFPLLQN